MDPHKVQLEQLKYLKRISGQQRLDYVMLRGCLTGLFYAAGTTIGFAIILLVLSRIISSTKEFPFINDILRDTKLDVLIESQIKNITGNGQSTPTRNEYKHQDLGIKFTYPANLSAQTSTKQNTADKEYEVIFEGTGSLNNLEIHTGAAPSLPVASRIEEVTIKFFGQDKIFTVYETDTRAVYYLSGESNGMKFYVIGKSDPATPKTGREVFRTVLESMQKSEG